MGDIIENFCVTHLNALLHVLPYFCGIVFQPAGIMHYLAQFELVIGQNFCIFCRVNL